MTDTETPDALNKEAIKQLRQAYDDFAFTARISPQRAEEMAWGLCQYLPALLDELERLKAENTRLKNDLCQVHTVNRCDGGCGRLFRMREVEIWDGKRLCVHCLKAEAERLMAAMPGVSAYDPHAVAGAEFGVGEKQP